MDKNSILKNYTSAIAWFSFLFIGLSGTIYFAPRVAGYLYNSGPETIAFFIAPFCACAFFVLICLYKRPSLLNLLLSLLLLVIIYIPLYKTWNQQYELAYKSDNFLYYRAARYMVQHASLNSRDNLLLNVKAGNQYLYQPGYKYYLGLLLLPSEGKLIRRVQFIGIFLFTFCNLLALYKIAGTILQNRVKTALLFFFLLMVPAAINNIMDGLTEGLFISVLLLFFFFYKNKNFVICS